MPSCAATAVLIALAVVGAADAFGDVGMLEEGLVSPLVELQLEKSGDPDMSSLKKSVSKAESVEEVKDKMKNTIKQKMKEKADELEKTAAKKPEPKTPDPMEKKEEKKAAKKKEKVEQQVEKAERRDDKEKANERRAKDKLKRAKEDRQQAEKKVESSKADEASVMSRKVAEEKAKTATALRIAAEENAKARTADKVAAEEEAKKSAAQKVMAKEQAGAARRSPSEILAMKAAAFRKAADLKTQEALALEELAGLKSVKRARNVATDTEEKKEMDQDKLSDAKSRLRSTVERAKRALAIAKNKPFDKDALKRVVQLRAEVKAGKEEVQTESEKINADKTDEKNAEQRVDRMKQRADGDKPLKPLEAVEKFVDEKKQSKGYKLRHPDVNNMSRKQIKYWANKKMKWRAEDPMKKTRVMQKIFQVKNMEAQTLTKMNELNIGIGMKSGGVRAAQMRKGNNVIVNGELIQPNAVQAVHTQRTFQGQKGRDPKTENKSRDPSLDKLKQMASGSLKTTVREELKRSDKQVDEAINARASQSKNMPRSPSSLKGISKAVVGNEAAIGGKSAKLPKIIADNSKSSTESTAPSTDEFELGDDDDDIEKPSVSTGESTDADNEEEGLVDKEDEDELSDDSEMNSAMDETSMEEDIDGLSVDKEYDDYDETY